MIENVSHKSKKKKKRRKKMTVAARVFLSFSFSENVTGCVNNRIAHYKYKKVVASRTSSDNLKVSFKNNKVLHIKETLFRYKKEVEKILIYKMYFNRRNELFVGLLNIKRGQREVKGD